MSDLPGVSYSDAGGAQVDDDWHTDDGQCIRILDVFGPGSYEVHIVEPDRTTCVTAMSAEYLIAQNARLVWRGKRTRTVEDLSHDK